MKLVVRKVEGEDVTVLRYEDVEEVDLEDGCILVYKEGDLVAHIPEYMWENVSVLSK